MNIMLKKRVASMILLKFSGSCSIRLILLLCLVLFFPIAVQGAEVIGKITKVTGTAYIERKSVVKSSDDSPGDGGSIG